MHTPLTDRFDLQLPLVCAPMAGVAGGRLAAAVSVAGALGMVGIGSTAPPGWIDDQLRAAARGGAPFGAGLMAWALANDGAPFDHAVSGGARLLSISFGDVAPWITRAHAGGVSVAVQAGTIEDARAAEGAGADFVVARGAEGGGHGRATVGTMVLLQQILDAVGVPVLAAGGIGTARGLAAVLAAGAAGAWVGTAFCCAAEADTAPAARAAIAGARADTTVYGRVFDIAQRLRWPAEFGGRAIANEFTRRWLGREAELAADDEARDELLAARAAGDARIAPVYAGEAVGLVDGDRPAAEIVADFARADEYLRDLARRLQ